MTRTCCMCHKAALAQNLKRVIDDKGNNPEVIGQARILLQLGYKKTDYFCQECFWK